MRSKHFASLAGSLALLAAPGTAPAAFAAQQAIPSPTPPAPPPFHLKDARLDAALISSGQAIEAASAKVQASFWPAVRAQTAALKAPAGSEPWEAARLATKPALVDLAAFKRAYQDRVRLLEGMEDSLAGDELAQVRSIERLDVAGALAAEEGRADLLFGLARIHPDEAGGS